MWYVRGGPPPLAGQLGGKRTALVTWRGGGAAAGHTSVVQLSSKRYQDVHIGKKACIHKYIKYKNGLDAQDAHSNDLYRVSSAFRW